jgi:photosystem II stability/assembly factor-like uncharacterized protein
MASTWALTANNETVSFNNLQDGVNTGVLSQKAPIPVSNEQITKAEANTYVNIDTAFAPYAAKASNQLVVKSNLSSTVSVNTLETGRAFFGIANNQTTSSPIQLISGRVSSTGRGEIYISNNYGSTYSRVLDISDRLNRIKFIPSFRHASYLSVPPFVSVGIDGRIVTNSNTAATSWINISSPTTQELYDIAFNSSVGIIVGVNRIIKTNTNNRINAWSIVNSVTANWRAVASNGSTFVAVGDDNAVITGNSLGTTWTVISLAPLSLKNLTGVTYHTDGFWYAVGYEVSNDTLSWIMRSSDDGASWSQYVTTGDSLNFRLNNINSIGGRLVISAHGNQYQIINNVVTRYNTLSYFWYDNVKDANSNGFDMAGLRVGFGGAYSNF